MTVSRIQGQPNLNSSARPLARPRPQGLAQTPDRLEDRSEAHPDTPPSFFKEFLFKPVIHIIKFMIKGIFTFIEFLRQFAFEEKSVEPAHDREAFLDRLRSAPSPEMLLLQFSQAYSKAEQKQVYRSIGEAHTPKVSWKEVIWDRSDDENIELGRSLVRKNPFLLRDPLSNS